MATKNQERVFKRVLDKVINGDKISVSKEMRGIYKPSMTKKPTRLTKSKGWEELMEQYLPDTLLVKKHKELLNIPKVIKQIKRGKIIEQTEEVDSQALGKGLDMGYKLKGYYKPEKREHSGKIEMEWQK